MNLVDRQINKILNERNDKLQYSLSDLGELNMSSKTLGPHFRFYDRNLGGFFLRNVQQPEQYRGAEWDWLLIDELTELSRKEFGELLYPLRSGRNLPFKAMGAASNPDGLGHPWVKRLWIEGEFDVDESDAYFHPEDFVFIQAMAWHNPTFNPTIERNIKSDTDPMRRKARWDGSWDLNLGGRFEYNSNIHRFTWDQFTNAFGEGYSVHDILTNPDMIQLFGSLDYGTSVNAGSVYYIHGMDFKHRYWTLFELYMQGVSLANQVKRIKSREGDLAPFIKQRFADPALWGKDDDQVVRAHRFRDRGVKLVKAKNDRIEGWATLEEMLHYQLEDGELVSQPRWRIHQSCRHLSKFLSSAPRGMTRPEDVDPKFEEDHAGDSARYGIHSKKRGPDRTPAVGSIEWMRRQARLSRSSQARWHIE